MSKVLAFSDDLEYNTLYFTDSDSLQESFAPESNGEFLALTSERIQELKDLLAFEGWNRHERRELKAELHEARQTFAKLRLFNVG